MASMVGYMRDYLPKDMPEHEQLQRCAEFFNEHKVGVEVAYPSNA